MNSTRRRSAGSQSPAVPSARAVRQIRGAHVTPLLAASLLGAALLAACARQGPREFDVSPQAEAVAPPEAPAANLAGTWQFNPRESDQPGQYGRGGAGEMGGGRRGGGMGGRGGMPGGGGGFPGGGRGGYPGGSGGGSPPGGDRPDGAQGGRAGEGGGAAIVGASPRLVISQTDSSVTFTRPNGVAFNLFFDGREVTVPGRTDDESMQVSGRWHRKRFEVRREISSQRTVTESFELSSDGTKLTVRTRFSGQGNGEQRAMPELRRVYDRQAPGARSPEPGRSER